MLSDILSDPLDMIASGPACADSSTCVQAKEISEKYHLTGPGKGGRNQELALAAAQGLRGLQHVLLFSVGSDGTDGPTDAAGDIVDGDTAEELERQGISIHTVLQNNDAYSALKRVNGLIFTGATGTNANDVTVLLIKR